MTKRMFFILLLMALLFCAIVFLSYKIFLKAASAGIFEYKKTDKSEYSESVPRRSSGAQRSDALFNEARTKNMDDPDVQNEFINKGIKAYLKKNYDEALKYLNAVASAAPYNKRVYLNRVIVKSELGDYEGALEDCGISLEVDPERVMVYYNKAFIYYEMRDYVNALKNVNECIENGYIGGGETFVLKGNILSADGRYAEAAEAYSAAISISNNAYRKTLYFWRGEYRFKSGDYRGALEDYYKATEYYPDNGEYFFKRAEAKNMLGDTRGAQEDYKKAAERRKK